MSIGNSAPDFASRVAASGEKTGDVDLLPNRQQLPCH